MMSRLLLKRNNSELGEASAGRLAGYVHESGCPLCHGKRLNEAALSCKVAGYDISEMCGMELTRLKRILEAVTDPQGSFQGFLCSGTLTGKAMEMRIPVKPQIISESPYGNFIIRLKTAKKVETKSGDHYKIVTPRR